MSDDYAKANYSCEEAAAQMQPKIVCRYYLERKCTRDDSCRYAHPENVGMASTSTNMEASSSCEPTFDERHLDLPPVDLARDLPTASNLRPPHHPQVAEHLQAGEATSRQERGQEEELLMNSSHHKETRDSEAADFMDNLSRTPQSNNTLMPDSLSYTPNGAFDPSVRNTPPNEGAASGGVDSEESANSSCSMECVNSDNSRDMSSIPGTPVASSTPVPLSGSLTSNTPSSEEAGSSGVDFEGTTEEESTFSSVSMECVNSDNSDNQSPSKTMSSIPGTPVGCSTPIPDSRPITPGPWHPENTNTPPSEEAGSDSVGSEGRKEQGASMDGWNDLSAWRNISSINSAIEDSDTPMPDSSSYTPNGGFDPTVPNTPPNEEAGSVGTEGRTGEGNQSPADNSAIDMANLYTPHTPGTSYDPDRSYFAYQPSSSFGLLQPNAPTPTELPSQPSTAFNISAPSFFSPISLDELPPTPGAGLDRFPTRFSVQD